MHTAYLRVQINRKVALVVTLFGQNSFMINLETINRLKSTNNYQPYRDLLQNQNMLYFITYMPAHPVQYCL